MFKVSQIYEEIPDKIRKKDMDNDNKYEVDGNVDPENDEEITSDDAFNSSDDEKYGEFFPERPFNRGKKHSSFDGDNILNETDDEVVDSEIEDEEDSDNEQLENDSDNNEQDEEEEEQDDESALEDSNRIETRNQMDSNSDSEEEEQIDLSKLLDYSEVKSNESKKPRISNLNPESTYEQSEKVSLNDLVGALKNTTSFGGLKKQVKKLVEKETISAPLPYKLKERLDRTAAYELSKKEISKWIPLVKKNRESEQVQLEIMEPSKLSVTLASISTYHQPTTEMEKQIAFTLENSNLNPESIIKSEELELNKISKEEMILRRNELLKMRSLLFYNELKQKKISKIKSKTYRKMHKNKGGEESIGLDELVKLDPEGYKSKMIEIEANRAKKRMSLKHKNTGKWAKQIKGQKDPYEDSRKSIIEQIQKHDELKRKIIGEEDESSGDDESENEMNELFTKQSNSDNEEMGERDDENKSENDEEMTLKYLKQFQSSSTLINDENDQQFKAVSIQLGNKYKREKENETKETIKIQTKKEKKPLNRVFINQKTSESSASDMIKELTPGLDTKQSNSNNDEMASDNNDVDSDSDDKSSPVLSKQEILKMAFGNDESQSEQSESEPEPESNELAGWGSWTNDNKSIHQKKKIKVIKIEKPLQKKPLNRVFINPKISKSSASYMVKELPHGYDNKQQFERVMRMPLGKEWNTASIYQARIKPKYHVKPGSVVLPIK